MAAYEIVLRRGPQRTMLPMFRPTRSGGPVCRRGLRTCTLALSSGVMSLRATHQYSVNGVSNSATLPIRTCWITINPSDWRGSEVRYCPMGSDRPQRHNVGTMKRERFALGIAVYEIVEWKVSYGPEVEVSEGDIIAALVEGK